MKEELLKGLSEEQIAKLEACNSPEEILAAAKEEGIELNDEQLEAVSGGAACGDMNAPDIKNCLDCGSPNIRAGSVYGGAKTYTCKDCGATMSFSIYTGKRV